MIRRADVGVSELAAAVEASAAMMLQQLVDAAQTLVSAEFSITLLCLCTLMSRYTG